MPAVSQRLFAQPPLSFPLALTPDALAATAPPHIAETHPLTAWVNTIARRWLGLGLHQPQVAHEISARELMAARADLRRLIQRPRSDSVLEGLEVDEVIQRDQFLRRLDTPPGDDLLSQRLSELVRELRLPAIWFMVLGVAYAAHTDPCASRLLRLCAGRNGMTLRFVLELIDPHATSYPILCLAPALQDLALVEATPHGEGSDLDRPFAISEILLRHLRADPPQSTTVPGVSWQGEAVQAACIAESTHRAIKNAMRHATLRRAILIHGPARIGPQHLVESCATPTAQAMVNLDLALLHQRPDAATRLRQAAAMAFLGRAPLHLRNAHLLDSSAGQAKADFLRQLDRLTALPWPALWFSATAPVSVLQQHLSSLTVIAAESPSSSTCRSHWQGLMAPFAPDHEARETLFTTFKPAPAEMLTIHQRCSERTKQGRRLDSAELHTLTDQVVQPRFSEVAQRVTLCHRLGDLCAPPETLEAIQRLLHFAHHRARIAEIMGTRLLQGQSPGVTALFKGPPGTGKSMAAAIVARELGLELFRVDLAHLTSKYIGDTEKNLAQLFDEANKGEVVLLFDEADALFASRTQINNANDRHANGLVNYLLQRLESFGGVALLTTNHARAIDNAFARRIRFHIDFPPPCTQSRLRLWRAFLPEHLHNDPGLDGLASDLEISGGHLRNAFLRAATHALATQGPLDIPSLRQACVEELRQQGHLVRDAS